MAPFCLLRKLPSLSILPWQLFPESWFLQAMDPTKPKEKKVKYMPAVYEENEKQRQQVRESVSIQCREETNRLSQLQRKE